MLPAEFDGGVDNEISCNYLCYMKSDSRLPDVLHLLLHMAELGEMVTSERLARIMQTNPVVVRRLMAGLRRQGIVRSEKGHGGGWSLARPLDQLTLADVYDALGEPSLFSIGHRHAATECLVEQAVNAMLGQALADARALLLERFAQVTLAQLKDDFHARLRAMVQKDSMT